MILDELDQIKQNTWPDWPEEDLYDTDSDEWKVFPLVHTFPGNVLCGQHVCRSTAA